MSVSESVSESILAKAIADRRAALDKVAELKKELEWHKDGLKMLTLDIKAKTGKITSDHDAWASMGREIATLRTRLGETTPGTCGQIARCGRPADHRGQHGGWRMNR